MKRFTPARKSDRPLGVSKKQIRKASARERKIFAEAQKAIAHGSVEELAEILEWDAPQLAKELAERTF